MINNLHKDVINHNNLERNKMLEFVIELIESRGDVMEFHLEETMMWIRYNNNSYKNWFSISMTDRTTQICIDGKPSKQHKYTILDDEKLYELLKTNIIRTKQTKMYVNNDEKIKIMQDIAGMKRKRIIADLLETL